LVSQFQNRENDPVSTSAERPTSRQLWGQGLLWFALSNAVVLVGVGWAARHPQMDRPEECLFWSWDGNNYFRVCKEGYSYDPARRSLVAFFPGYPLAARVLTQVFALPARAALLLVAQLSLAGCFVALAFYVRERWPTATLDQVRNVLVAFAFLPTTFFFRMAYSESLFLLLLILPLLGMRRHWPLAAIAFLAGGATAVRVVGVALLPPLLLYLWQQSAGGRQFLLRAAWLVPLACWGVLGFMAGTWIAFGDPLAFLHSVPQWVHVGKAAEALLTLRPLWTNFDPASPCYWRREDPYGNPWLGLTLGNAVWFTATGLLLLGGTLRRKLDAAEAWLSAGLWFIPYLTRGHEMCMGGAARYAAVIFPVYLLLGQIGDRLPRWVSFALVAAGAWLLVIYTFKFALVLDPYFY
jgi:hypothetical protein